MSRGRAFRRAAALMVLTLSGCAGDPPPGPALSAPVERDSDQRRPAQFRDVAAETGLEFTHDNGATGAMHMPEIMGAGVALFDYDRDGDLDVYLVQGAAPRTNRLFRNELVPTGSLRFADVTEGSGLDHVGFGMGVAVGDIDNDGDDDLYLTNVGANALFRNQGDGRFVDVTETGDTADPSWSTSASFCDVDHDGDLDLYVTNYVAFDAARNKECASPGGQRDYCGPDAYPEVPDRLYENDGAGGFRDVSAERGIHAAYGPGLGVICVDFDADGLRDVFVANDGKANQLWLNRGERGFVEHGLMSGTAYNVSGEPEAGMGVAAGDFDGDGDEDLFLTHLVNETNTLYVNEGGGRFRDATDSYRLGFPSRTSTGFGTQWFDFDNDGLLDLFIANGNVKLEESRSGISDYPFEQPNQLFRNLGSSFEDVSASAGAVLQQPEISRGIAVGDIDNDGDVDLVQTNNGGPVRLLRNETTTRSHWLLVTLVNTGEVRHADGARVVLLRSGQSPLWRRAHTDGSYLSASDRRVHFGLGPSGSIDGLRVEWPDGDSEVWRDVGADRRLVLTRGE
ncbi:MAG: CRTAC1 family protein [bacterium]|nr:CRTAC1 family protein [bacterium]